MWAGCSAGLLTVTCTDQYCVSPDDLRNFKWNEILLLKPMWVKVPPCEATIATNFPLFVPHATCTLLCRHGLTNTNALPAWTDRLSIHRTECAKWPVLTRVCLTESLLVQSRCAEYEIPAFPEEASPDVRSFRFDHAFVCHVPPRTSTCPPILKIDSDLMMLIDPDSSVH